MTAAVAFAAGLAAVVLAEGGLAKAGGALSFGAGDGAAAVSGAFVAAIRDASIPEGDSDCFSAGLGVSAKVDVATGLGATAGIAAALGFSGIGVFSGASAFDDSDMLMLIT